MRRNARGEGTWSEVVFWLRRRGVYSKRSALRSKDLKMTRVYREHSEACLEAAARLEVKILEAAFATEIDRADNPQLSAHSTLLRGQYHTHSRWNDKRRKPHD